MFASAVAEFGMLMRDSKFKGGSSFEHVINAAKEAKGKDPHGYRAGFVELAKKAKALFEKK